MRKAAVLAAVASLAMMQLARADYTGGSPSYRLVERTVKVDIRGYDILTLFLRLPEGGRVDGVLCLCNCGADTDNLHKKE